MSYLPYDKKDPLSIKKYAEKLINKTFYDVIEDFFEQENYRYYYDDEPYGNEFIKENFSSYDKEESIKYISDFYNNAKNKGGLGNLLEKYYFYYNPNSESKADFYEANLELKVTPYEKTSKNKLRAGERLVLSMIPYDREIESDFMKSDIISKVTNLLLIFYYRNKKEIKNRINYRIDYVTLFSILSDICKADLEIIKEDYEKIVTMIKMGKANELSEGMTQYLGACTKGLTAEKSLRPQFYNKEILAKRRAFSLKQSYMTYIINNYVLNNINTYESIYTEKDLMNIDFECGIIEKLDKYIGWSISDLCKKFDITKNSKNRNNILVCRILGIKSDKIAEFEKANIKIKTIHLKENGVPKENMSFPTFKIKDFINEKFENSEIYRYFSETKFLFVVFENKEQNDYLKESYFWTMPVKDLEGTGCREWKRIQDIFKEGVCLKIKKTYGGKEIVNNNLPKMKNTEIFHLRPHASKSVYIIDNKKYGNGDIEKDGDLLPNGDVMTKQCFWLNNKYIKNQLEKLREERKEKN